MMKLRASLLLVLAVLVIGAVACKKCVTCKVKDQVGNTMHYAEEKCGTKSELEQWESELLEQYYCKTYTVKDSDGIVIFISKQVCSQEGYFYSVDSALYWTFIADSPTVSSVKLENKVYCVN